MHCHLSFYLNLLCASRGLFLSLVHDIVGDTWGLVKWLSNMSTKPSCHSELQFPIRCV